MTKINVSKLYIPTKTSEKNIWKKESRKCMKKYTTLIKRIVNETQNINKGKTRVKKLSLLYRENILPEQGKI